MLAYFVRYGGSAQMLELIPPMGSVLLTWLLLFLLFSGLGIAVLKTMGQPLASGWIWLDSFWLGWALALGLMQFWHLLLPVNDGLLLLLAIGAAPLLIWQGRSFGATLSRLTRKKPFLLIFALLALWMANRALGMPIAFDTGYRDIQIVYWLDAYPIVPGLGNLFSSFAFNHSVYLYDALLDTSIWSGRSYHIATGLLLLVYLAYALGAALQVYRSRAAEELRWSRLFASLTIPFILFQTVRGSGVTHFLTDTVVDLIGFLTLICLLDFLQYWRVDSKSDDYLAHRLAIIVLTGLTVKQSYVVFGLATASLSALIWIRRGGLGAGPRRVRRTLLPIVLLALALLLPWVARGVITSGYVAFPQSIGRFELDWTIPAEEIANRQLKLATNTRIREGDPAIVLASWAWLGPWLRDFIRNVFPTLLPTCVSAISLALYIIGIRKQRREWQARALSWPALLPLMIMLGFWFVTAPEEKYVRYVFWGFAALSTTMAALTWHWVAWRRRVWAVLALVLICLAYVIFLIIRHDEILIPAGPHDGFHAHYLPQYDRIETADGLVLHVPSNMNQCWHIPLPCTPYLHSALSARVPGELRHGFRIMPKARAG